MLRGFSKNTAGVSEFVQEISVDLADNALTPLLVGEGSHVLGGEKGELGNVKCAAEISSLMCQRSLKCCKQVSPDEIKRVKTAAEMVSVVLL